MSCEQRSHWSVIFYEQRVPPYVYIPLTGSILWVKGPFFTLLPCPGYEASDELSCFSRLQYHADNKPLDEVLSVPHFCGWCFVASGVLLYLTAFIHLLCGWNICSTVSVCTHTLYLSSPWRYHFYNVLFFFSSWYFFFLFTLCVVEVSSTLMG